ncbi:MAG: ABC transporter permease [Candidatus Odinarchaeota archaeon]
MKEGQNGMVSSREPPFNWETSNRRLSGVFKLVYVKLIAMKKLYLLMIGVFLIAVISGAATSYVGGLAEKEFFLGESDNVLVIADRTASTPVTGIVPEYIVKNLELLPGVVTCSSEILTIGIVNSRQNKVAIIRGVDPDIFRAIDNPRVIEGKWLSTSSDGETTGLVAGKKIFDFLNLQLGDELVVSSTVEETTLLFKICGVIETNTPLDEELIIPLYPAKILAGRQQYETTLIRVLYDDTIISKSAILRIVNSEFDVPVSLAFMNGTEFTGYTGTMLIKARAYTGKPVSEAVFETGKPAYFTLPFGLYHFDVIFDPANLEFLTQRVTTFVNQSSTEPLLIHVEKYDANPNVSISVLFEKHGLPVSNLTVTLTDVFKGFQEMAATDNDGLVEFIVGKEKLYTLDYTWFSFQRRETFFASKNTFIAVNLTTDLVFSVNNASTLEPVAVDSGNQVLLTLLKKEANSSLTTIFDKEPVENTSRSVLPLVPGQYFLTLNYGSFSRSYTFQQGFSSSKKDFFIGNGTFNVHLAYINGTPIQQANVTASDLGDSSSPIQSFTDNSGVANLELTAGRRYLLSLSSGNLSNQFEFSFDKGQHFWNTLRESYPLEIKVYNNGFLDKPGINGVLLEIIRDDMTYQQLTNASGSAIFNLTDQNIYKLLIHHESDMISLNISSLETSYREIPLGSLVFDLLAVSPANHSFNGVTISVFNRTSGKNELLAVNSTNEAGLCKVEIPVVYGTSTSIVITADFQGVTKTWTGTFTSSSYNKIVFYFERTLEKVLFKFRDVRGYPIDDLLVKLQPVSSDFDYYGRIARTNETGIASFDNLNLGIYKLYYNWNGLEEKDVVLDSIEGEQPPIFEIRLDEIVDRLINTPEDDVFVTNKWLGNRQYLVTDSAGYARNYFSRTLSIVTTTFFSVIVIVSAISFLAVASMISFPISQQIGELKILKRLGATNSQISLAMAVQFTLIAFLSSLIGVIVGYLLVTSIADLGTANVAGILLVPRFDFLSLSFIVIIACLTVFIRTGMLVNKTVRNA